MTGRIWFFTIFMVSAMMIMSPFYCFSEIDSAENHAVSLNRELAVSAQTGRTRVVFEENTGLSKAWSSNFFDGIITSDVFKEQIDKLTGA